MYWRINFAKRSPRQRFLAPRPQAAAQSPFLGFLEGRVLAFPLGLGLFFAVAFGSGRAFCTAFELRFKAVLGCHCMGFAPQNNLREQSIRINESSPFGCFWYVSVSPKGPGRQGAPTKSCKIL